LTSTPPPSDGIPVEPPGPPSSGGDPAPGGPGPSSPGVGQPSFGAPPPGRPGSPGYPGFAPIGPAGQAYQSARDPTTAYPKQLLSDQEIQSRRSRRPLIIALVVVLVLVAVGVGAYFVFAGNGGGNRAAYCKELRVATKNGRLSEVLSGSGQTDVFGELRKLRDLAPDNVHDNWSHLVNVVSSAQSGKVTPDMVGVLNDLSAIRNDANASCHLSIGF
jgi:hypothetical protein